ncbi:DUF2283 domain-containing protein [Actinomadura hibisca]|uniref:DUF2283 domain-containing protein n=1 Tax=Actinomadura hibisca TaxID=68565 RepID=UPI00082FCAA2|nr:DUF2283 domain-containing protein [Actinomadura hibisca]
MKIDYDFDANALYITLSDAPTARTVEIDPETMVDLDAAGKPVGIEVIAPNVGWPLSRIIAEYDISQEDAARLRAFNVPAVGVHQAAAPAVPA